MSPRSPSDPGAIAPGMGASPRLLAVKDETGNVASMNALLSLTISSNSTSGPYTGLTTGKNATSSGRVGFTSQRTTVVLLLSSNSEITRSASMVTTMSSAPASEGVKYSRSSSSNAMPSSGPMLARSSSVAPALASTNT